MSSNFETFLTSHDGLLCRCEESKEIPPAPHPSLVDTTTNTTNTTTNYNNNNNNVSSSSNGSSKSGADESSRKGAAERWGLAEIVRGCIQAALRPDRLKAPGLVFPVDENSDEDDDAEGNEDNKASSCKRLAHLTVQSSCLWVEGGAGMYRQMLQNMVQREVEQQMGFVEAFRQEEESMERRCKTREKERERAIRDARLAHQPPPTFPNIPPSKSILERWGSPLSSAQFVRSGLTIGSRFGYAMDGDHEVHEVAGQTNPVAAARQPLEVSLRSLNLTLISLPQLYPLSFFTLSIFISISLRSSEPMSTSTPHKNYPLCCWTTMSCGWGRGI